MNVEINNVICAAEEMGKLASNVGGGEIKACDCVIGVTASECSLGGGKKEGEDIEKGRRLHCGIWS